MGFWFKFLMGFGAALFLILMVFIFLSEFGAQPYTEALVYYEIVLSAYLVLLSIMISRQGEKFPILYAILSLADVAGLFFLFGFNAVYSYSGVNNYPWSWHISNISVIFVTFPLNLLMLLMLAGAIGQLFWRIGLSRNQMSPG